MYLFIQRAREGGEEKQYSEAALSQTQACNIKTESTAERKIEKKHVENRTSYRPLVTALLRLGTLSLPFRFEE